MAELRRYTGAMTPFRALTLACLLAAPALAGAQWMYLDKDGRKVFSDKAPPPETPPGKILRQPGMKKAAADAPQAPASTPAQAAAAPASAPRISGKDKELEERRKQVEAAEAEKNKARAEAQAKVQAENCARAKQMKATLDSGQRIARMNAKGEREIMDDAQRAAEGKRIDGIIAADCKTAQ
jgi:Domain of unknown function (DUF4124)